MMQGIQASFGLSRQIYSSKVSKPSPQSGFDSKLDQTGAECVAEELMQKYQVPVSVRSVPKGQKEVTSEIMRGGLSTITIAPSIAEKMNTDANVRNEVEQDIQRYFRDQQSLEIQLAATGDVPTASGIIIHEDGTWTHWSGCAPSPEKMALMRREEEAKKKEEREEQLRLELYMKRSNRDRWMAMKADMLDSGALMNVVNFSANEEYSSIPPQLVALSLANALNTGRGLI